MEHPILVQRSIYLLRSQLWVYLGFLGGFVLLLFWFFSPLFIKIGHYWANTDFSLDIGKHRDDL